MSLKVIRITPLQHDILVAISQLISKREEEPNNNKKTTINAYSIAQTCGRNYNAVRKNLKKLKDI